jgi:hypothetical protein
LIAYLIWTSQDSRTHKNQEYNNEGLSLGLVLLSLSLCCGEDGGKLKNSIAKTRKHKTRREKEHKCIHSSKITKERNRNSDKKNKKATPKATPSRLVQEQQNTV